MRMPIYNTYIYCMPLTEENTIAGAKTLLYGGGGAQILQWHAGWAAA